MKVLVGYASAYGSTKGVAQHIGERLADAGLEVEVRAVDEVDSVGPSDAVVLGSAIHSGAWLPPAAAFVRTHGGELADRPLWLFSVGSVGETTSVFGERVSRLMRRMRREPAEIDRYRSTLNPRGHHSFAGVVERGHWGRVGDVFLWLFRGRYGDHRDWADIDAWADGIAQDLHAAVLGKVSPPHRPAGPTGARPWVDLDDEADLIEQSTPITGALDDER